MKNVNDQMERFWESQRGINTVYEEYARQVGLSYTTLYILAHIESDENCTQSTICERTYIPRQTVNSVITNLYKEGYVILKEVPEDRRTKTICFTDKGKEYAENILKRLHDAEYGAMESLSKEDQEQLIRTNKLYMDHFRRLIK